jgi:hypothetical protein
VAHAPGFESSAGRYLSRLDGSADSTGLRKRHESPATVVGTPPHPEAISAARPPGFSGHYYAGSVYSGTSQLANNLGVTLRVPGDRPEGGDANFYYVILSVWDNAGSYDQLGFANSFGTWGVAYSTTNYCATTYYYSPDAFELESGRLYDFNMSIVAGAVRFTISNATSRAVLWALVATTGGTEFLVQSTYGCDSGIYYDYTDYEEVYATSGPDIPYDLFFENNTVGTAAEASWADMGYPARTVLLDGANVTIENEPYYLSASDGRQSVAFPTGAPGGMFDWNLSVRALSSDGTIDLASYHTPSGWTVQFSPPSGTAPFGAGVTISFPAGTRSGSYSVGVNATDQSRSGSYSRTALEVTIGPEYLVTYDQDGLPAGTPWAIALGGLVEASTTATIEFRVPNGTYNNSVAPIPGYQWSPVGHSPAVVVSGSDLAEAPYVFVASQYLISFDSAGLPNGILWWVNVTDGPSTSANTSVLRFTVPNGTYSYTVAGACFVPTPSGGTLSVTGDSIRVTVSFANGTAPCVTVLAKTLDEERGYAGTTLNFSVPGRMPSVELILWAFGTFGPNPGYFPAPVLPRGMMVESSLGYAGVAVGAAPPGRDTVELPTYGFSVMSDVVVYAYFNAEGFTYRSADESGSGNLTLPGGGRLYLGAQATPGQMFPIEDTSLTTVDSQSSTWVTLNGVTNLVGRQSSPRFSMSTNATTFGMAAVGLYPGPRYAVSFDESGLRPGASWSVTVGGATRSATESSMTFSLFNGSYDFVIRGPSETRVVAQSNDLSPTGQLTVNGAPLHEPVAFRRAPTHSLMFSETGLRPETTWCVTLGPTICSSQPRLSFGNLTPWTYAYSVLTVTGYSAVVKSGGVTGPPSGASNLTRRGATVRVRFSPLTYGISFVQYSLSTGARWHVRANCSEGSGTDSGCDGWSKGDRAVANNLTLELRNGSYEWKVSPVRGYELVFNDTVGWSGYVTVNGVATTLYLSFFRIGSVPGGVSVVESLG